MSELRTEILECPRCAKEMEMEFWNSINVTLDPELKEKLLDDSLFTHKCNSCGNTTYIEYGLLYHDMDKQLMLFFSPNKREENNCIKLPNDFGLGMENYTFRAVEGEYRLKELILMLDAGLDDVTLTYLKYLIKNKIIGTSGYDFQNEDSLFFDGIEEDHILIALYNHKFDFMGRFRLHIVDKYLVSKTKIDNDPRFADANGYRIDEDWIHSKLIKL